MHYKTMTKTRNVVLAALLGAVSIPGAAIARDIIFSTHTPATHSNNKVMVPNYFDRINAALNGGLNYKLVTGGALASASTIVNALRSGAVDAGAVSYNNIPSELPVLVELANLSFYAEDPRVASAAITDMLLVSCEQCMTEQEANGIKVMFNPATAPYQMMCNSPATSLETVKGLKFRALGSYAKFVASIGAVPVNVAIAETYEALQRGTIDCTFNDLTMLDAYHFADVVKYVTDLPGGSFLGIGAVVIRNDLWKDFSAEERSAWLGSAPMGIIDFLRSAEDAKQVAVARMPEAGVAEVKADQDLWDALAAYRGEEATDAIDSARKRGVKDPEAVVAEFVAASEKWTAIVDAIGPEPWGDAEWQAYADKLKTEIYDKVQ